MGILTGGFAAALIAASASAAEAPAPTYIIVGGGRGEVVAMDKTAVRKIAPGIVEAQLTVLMPWPKDLEDAGGKSLGKADYTVGDMRIDCRKKTFSPLRQTAFREDGSVVHVETFPAGAEGWINELTGPVIELACSDGKRAAIKGKRYASPAAFLPDVRRAHEAEMSSFEALIRDDVEGRLRPAERKR